MLAFFYLILLWGFCTLLVTGNRLNIQLTFREHDKLTARIGSYELRSIQALTTDYDLFLVIKSSRAVDDSICIANGKSLAITNRIVTQTYKNSFISYYKLSSPYIQIFKFRLDNRLMATLSFNDVLFYDERIRNPWPMKIKLDDVKRMCGPRFWKEHHFYYWTQFTFGYPLNDTNIELFSGKLIFFDKNDKFSDLKTTPTDIADVIRRLINGEVPKDYEFIDKSALSIRHKSRFSYPTLSHTFNNVSTELRLEPPGSY